MSSRKIIAWPVPTFQMMIWLSQPEQGDGRPTATVEMGLIHPGRIVKEATAQVQVQASDFTCTKEDIACRWVPCDNADTLGVAFQYHYGFRHGGDKAILRNLPNLQRTPTPM